MNRGTAALAALLALASAQPAWADDGEAAEQPADASEARPWSVALGGGTSITGGNTDQWYASVELSRTIGEGHLSIGYSRSDDDGAPGLAGALAARSNQFTLAGGYGVGPLSLDAYATLGRRTFDAKALRRRNGQPVTITGKGKSLTFGASLSAWVPLGENTGLSPSIAIDRDRTDTARAALVGQQGLVSIRKRESGTTGTAGLALSHAFGPEGSHSIGGSFSYATTSNAGASSGSIRRSGGTRLLRPRGSPGQHESWAALGVDASFALGGGIDLTLSASRTSGMTGPESTSLSAGLAFGF